MSIIRRLAITAALGASVGSVVALAGEVASNEGEASALAPCRDSNGSRPGGVVYVINGRSLGCDVSRPQTLTVTRVRTQAACDDMGGRYNAGSDTCWRVDY
jgi:hypothetical protein